MTDTYHTLTVVLEKDMRSDDAEKLISAIAQMRNVLQVSGVVSDISDHMAQVRARRELSEALWSVIYPKSD